MKSFGSQGYAQEIKKQQEEKKKKKRQPYSRSSRARQLKKTGKQKKGANFNIKQINEPK